MSNVKDIHIDSDTGEFPPMTTASPTARSMPGGLASWLRRAEAWLDDRGRGAWIAAMVLSFVFVWPLGLAFLAYITVTNRWNKDMFKRSSSFCGNRGHGYGQRMQHRSASSGNSTFDAYKSDTLRRLEEEQAAFESFLQRLRDAKDKSEFDTFMEDRARANRETATESPTSAAAADTSRGGTY